MDTNHHYELVVIGILFISFGITNLFNIRSVGILFIAIGLIFLLIAPPVRSFFKK